MFRITTVGLCLIISSLALARQVSFVNSMAASKAELSTRAFSRGAENGFEVQFSLPAIDLENYMDGFQEVKAANLSPLGTLGKPDTLVTGTLFVVPEGYEYEVKLTQQQEQEVKDTVLRPAQAKWRCQCKESFSFDSALYKSEAVYPELPFQVEEVGRMQGIRLARISVQPLRMDFSRRLLRVTTQLGLNVTLRRVREVVKPTLVPKSIFEFARRFTANGSALTREGIRVVEAETYLIFTADSLQASLSPFIQWKRSKGFHVETFNFTQVGGTKEKLKEFIQKYYDNHAVKPSYVLFVGNGDLVPPFMEEVTTSFNGPAASDLPYTLLAGNDSIPDLFYGRLVASNDAEVRTQIERWIQFEQHPEHAGDWYSKAMTIASNEGTSPSDKEYAEQIQTALKKFTYKSVDAFLQGEQTATESKISSAVNEGRSWLTYIGHGTGTGWGSTNDTFEVEQVEKLMNQRLLFLVDVACDNGSYVAIPGCFGKKWVTHEKDGHAAGAVAYYGGTVSISWDPPAIMSVGIAKTHFEKPVHSVGQSVLAGQIYLIEQKGTSADTLDNLKWYTLFGDPSLLLRSDLPNAIQVSHKIQSSDRCSGTVGVAVNNDKGSPLGNLLVSLIEEGAVEPAGVALTNAEGKVAIPLEGTQCLLNKPLQLTVTGYNIETFQKLLLP